MILLETRQTRHEDEDNAAAVGTDPTRREVGTDGPRELRKNQSKRKLHNISG